MIEMYSTIYFFVLKASYYNADFFNWFSCSIHRIGRVCNGQYSPIDEAKSGGQGKVIR